MSAETAKTVPTLLAKARAAAGRLAGRVRDLKLPALPDAVSARLARLGRRDGTPADAVAGVAGDARPDAGATSGEATAGTAPAAAQPDAARAEPRPAAAA